MRTSRRQLLLMAAGWLVVVVAAASLTFAAVDSADQSVGQPLSAPKVTGHQFPSRSSSSARRSPTPTGPTTPSPAATLTPAATPTTAAPSTAAASARPLSTPPAAQGPPTQTWVPPTTPPQTPPSPASTPPSDPPAPPAPRPPRVAGPSAPARSATFRTEGGSATASCRGTILALTAIAPQDGWRFHQESDQNHLDVTFDDGVQEVEIGLACVGGSPAEVTS